MITRAIFSSALVLWATSCFACASGALSSFDFGEGGTGPQNVGEIEYFIGRVQSVDYEARVARIEILNDYSYPKPLPKGEVQFDAPGAGGAIGCWAPLKDGYVGKFGYVGRDGKYRLILARIW